MNWKLRIKNKAVLMALISAFITFVYTVFGVLDLVPSIQQDQVIGVIGIILSLLTTLGVLIDPTTEGVFDSTRAMTYTKPKRSYR